MILRSPFVVVHDADFQCIFLTITLLLKKAYSKVVAAVSRVGEHHDPTKSITHPGSLCLLEVLGPPVGPKNVGSTKF